MGRLYELIQAHIDSQPYEVSERQVAKNIGVTQTTLSNWQHPKSLIAIERLEAIARVTGVPYIRVLDALLEDIGYIPSTKKPPPDEGEAVREDEAG